LVIWEAQVVSNMQASLLMDLYPDVRKLLEDAGCRLVAVVRAGVEGWESPRMGAFLVDNPIRSRANANNILRNAGCTPVF
jgi:hypothetical protein